MYLMNSTFAHEPPTIQPVQDRALHSTVGEVAVKIGDSSLYLTPKDTDALYRLLREVIAGRGDATETVYAQFSTSGAQFRPLGALDSEAAATMLEQAADAVRAGAVRAPLCDLNGETVGEVVVR